MKVAFDTSVIVAGSIAGHAHERRAAVWFEAASTGAIESMTTTHALAEVWATLTAIPVEPRVGPAVAERLVERFSRCVLPRALTWDDYRVAIERCADRSLRSGAIYDALHLVAAERWGADVLLTFNTGHFLRIARPMGPRILAPPDPPGLVELA